MKHKFKVGDVIARINFLPNKFKYKVTNIVEDEDRFVGPWVSGDRIINVHNSYIVQIIENSIMEYIGERDIIDFAEEHLYKCIPEVKNLNGEWNTTCKCGAPAFISMFSVTCSKGCNGQY